jgi:hypothetical protein
MPYELPVYFDRNRQDKVPIFYSFILSQIIVSIYKKSMQKGGQFSNLSGKGEGTVL